MKKNNIYYEALVRDRDRYYKARKKLDKALLIKDLNKLNKDFFYLIITNKNTKKTKRYYYLNINEKTDKKIFENKKMFIIVDGNIFKEKEYNLDKYNDITNNDINNRVLNKIKLKKVYTLHKNKQLMIIYKKIKQIRKKCIKNSVCLKLDNHLIGFINYNNVPWSILSDLSYLNKAMNINNKKKRYSYVYDVSCDILDEEFKQFNHCDFQDSKCVNFRSVNKKTNNNYGCCFINGKVCEHLKSNICSIKSLPCKLFVCRKFKKEGKSLQINDILLLKVFFNFRQKRVLEMSLCQDKDEIISKLLRKKHNSVKTSFF